MKRKQAMRPINGAIDTYLSMEDLNRMQNGLMPGAVSANNPCDVYMGTDYSYRTISGWKPSMFRQKFSMISDYVLESNFNDVFKIGQYTEVGHAVSRPVYYFFGYRVVLEYFDVNAIADFTGPIDEGADRENAIRHFFDLYQGRYQVNRLNEFLVNIKSL